MEFGKVGRLKLPSPTPLPQQTNWWKKIRNYRIPIENMKKPLIIVIALLVAALGYCQQHSQTSALHPTQQQSESHDVAPGITGDSDIEQAIQQRRTHVQITVMATVKKTLSDDNEGSRHQRFLVALPSGNTILVAHNIDLAERVPDLQPGATIELYGEYIWNDRGGVMHWTHHDPSGRHVAGWIKYHNRLYQ